MLKEEIVQSPAKGVYTKIRKTGIPAIGNAPWGTHFCQFYQTKEDLLDILVPYFKVGLENNESCMWVTSEPLSLEEAKEAMRKAMPDFDLCLKRGQIEVVPYSELYLKDGVFDLQRVLNALVSKLDQALAEGYDGLRVTGNTAWLERKDWRDFANYEEEVNRVIGKHRMIAICTYSLDKCSASEVIDVVRTHQFALIKRIGKWELIESSEIKRTKEALVRSEMLFGDVLAASPDAITVIDLNGNIAECNQATLDLLGYSSKDEVIGKNGFALVAKKDRERAIENLKKVLEQGSVKNTEYTALTKDGHEFAAELSASVIKDSSGNPTGFVAVTKDITERTKAQESLRETKNYLDSLLNHANAPIIVWDNEKRITLFNNAFEAFTGFKREQVLGSKIDVLFPPGEKKAILQTIESASKGRMWQSVEIPILRADKETRIALWNSASINDKEGKIAATIAQGQDITERTKAEEALIESEEKWRSLVENAPNVILIVDREDKIQFINRTVIDASPEEIIGRSIFNYIDPKYHNVVRKTIEQVFQTGAGGNYEISGTGPNGGTSWYQTQVGPIKHDGQISSVTLITVDITDRKQMEEKLRQHLENLEELIQKRTDALLESEKRYSVLVEEASDGVLIFQDEKIVFANKRVADILGYSKDEIVGLPIDVPVSKNHRQLVIERHQRRLRGEDVPATYEVDGLSKTGELVPLELSVARINYLGRPASLVLVRDIRKRKQMEEQHLKLEKLAAIGELATMVGHDLRNPLQSIENATYYLNSELSNLSAPVPISQKTMEMLKVINDSVNYADKIILDLQDFSATKKPLLEKTDINAIVKDTMSQFQIPKNVKLISELDRLPEIKADKNQMKRVFLNLTSNALQAMENGGTLTVSTKRANGFVEVNFKDTGVGIAKENIEKLFSPFFTTKAKGMGMGLSICKKFVESHGGSIKVETEEGKGSTFRVKLPLPQENGGENH